MKKKDLFWSNNKINFYAVVVSIVLLYILKNFILSAIPIGTIFRQVIELFLWLGLIVFIWKSPRLKYGGKLKLRNDINWWAFSAALIHVLITFGAGFFDGIGKSPYNHSISGSILNIIFVGVSILGNEMVRSYLINHFKMKRNQIPLYTIGIGMGVLGISIQQLFNLQEYEEIFKYISRYIIPGISKSILATYLAYLGGPIPSTIYMGIIEGIHWLSPVLPDMVWLTEAIIGFLVPILSYLMIENIYRKSNRKIRKEKYREGVIGWGLTCILSVGIIWFVVGVFPIYPSVIATGSMEPVIYPGDVIVIDKVQKEEDIQCLQVGDIIQFERDGILISHRIIEHKQVEGMDNFYTKGDNNRSADKEIVKGDMIKGKVIKVIPKVGWLTLLVKGGNKDVPEEINYGTKVVELERKE